ncbi:MAG TPA: TolC family protein [Methylophilaceae bacterium]|jgi:outer membrane protein TolC
MSHHSRKKPKILGCCFLLIAIIHINAYAEEEGTHHDVLNTNDALTLHDVTEKAFARNPMQASLQVKKYGVEAKNIMANSLLPHAPAVSLQHQNDALTSNRGERDWQAEVELPVWLPSQRSSRLGVAEASNDDLQKNRENTRLESAGKVRDALWDIAMNTQLSEVASKKLQATKQLEDDVNKRYRAGELAKVDWMLAEQETLAAERFAVRAEAELMHARHRYIVLTGLSDMPAQYEEQKSDIEDYNQSPLWLAAESRVSVTERERELVRVERRENPQVLINARTQRGPFDNAYNDSVGLKVRIPLDSQVRSAPLQASAEEAVGSAMTERESIRFSLETALHEAEHNLSVSQEELRIATKQHEIAQESLRLARKAFQLGETDLVNLVRVQTQTFETERAYQIRQIQLKWDIARYNQAVGVLP